jgi:hypothetical protein
MLRGQQGINLIERIVLEMGCIWNPTGPLDIGIDGTIELCDRDTGEPLGLFLHIQSKATDFAWERETADGFDYTCRSQDVDYWMQGNAPVLLIVSRPGRDEAYWISIKDYFRDPARRQNRRAHFEKAKDRFTPDAYAALFELAKPQDAGLYLAATPKVEELLSNLLEVRAFAPRIYIGDTPFRQRRDVGGAFRELGESCPSEWLLKEKRILSFRDLREFPWDRVCDRGTVEYFSADEWAFSPDADRRRDFVQLLNGALREKLFPQVRPWGKLGLYAFTASKNLKPRTIRYSSHSRSARRTVFEVYARESQGNVYTHYRHMAFRGRFHLYEGRWYLEITPTYLFTLDGYHVHRLHSEWLKGIKRLDRNRAVLAQLLVWVQYLQQNGDLFSQSYPYLSFGRLAEFALDVGIDDGHWQEHDETVGEAVESSDSGQMTLMDA